MIDLTGRAALVTGAGRRVGRELAIRLGQEGMRVAVHFNRSRDGAVETLRMLEELGGGGMLCEADLADPASAEPLVETVVAELGSLHVLVNSAAVMLRTPFGQIDARLVDEILALNARAPLMLAQAAAPALRKSHGCIVNIADLAAFEHWPGYLPHGMSKAAVVHLTESLARVLAPDVRVNAIAPGAVLLPDDWSDESAGRLQETTPLGRLGDPSDVADAMMYLVRAGYVTGETIVVDGGRRIRR